MRSYEEFHILSRVADWMWKENCTSTLLMKRNVTPKMLEIAEYIYARLCARWEPIIFIFNVIPVFGYFEYIFCKCIMVWTASSTQIHMLKSWPHRLRTWLFIDRAFKEHSTQNKLTAWICSRNVWNACKKEKGGSTYPCIGGKKQIPFERRRATVSSLKS